MSGFANGKKITARLPRVHSELYENFIRVATPEQLERFEHWKRSKFPRAAMRRLMADILGTSNERGAIVLVRRALNRRLVLGTGCVALERSTAMLRWALRR